MLPTNTVLYADDDVDDLHFVKEIFSNYSNDVQLVTVSDGLEVMSFLKNLPKKEPTPCLIILDINMPKMNGKQTLEDLRKMERFEEVPVILFTTSSHPKDQAFAYAHNAGFLTKPIDYDQMSNIADKFMAQCSDEIKRKIKRDLN